MITEIARRMIQMGHPVYVTNGLLETTQHLTVDFLRAKGLDYHFAHGASDYSPLTRRQFAFVAERAFATQFSGLLHLGYVGFFAGQLWLMPNVEFYFTDEQTSVEADRETALENARRFAVHAQTVLGPLGVLVKSIPDADDSHHTVQLLANPAWVERAFLSYYDWGNFLHSVIGDPTDQPDVGNERRVLRAVADHAYAETLAEPKRWLASDEAIVAAVLGAL